MIQASSWNDWHLIECVPASCLLKPRTLQAFEVLQLYLELLSIRMALIDKARDLPPDMVEAISSLIYASQRTSELQVSSQEAFPLWPWRHPLWATRFMCSVEHFHAPEAHAGRF